MILGRNPALWLALITAGLNATVALNWVTLDGAQLGIVNTFFIALIGVIANESDPTTAGTLAMTTKAPVSGSVTKTE